MLMDWQGIVYLWGVHFSICCILHSCMLIDLDLIWLRPLANGLLMTLIWWANILLIWLWPLASDLLMTLIWLANILLIWLWPLANGLLMILIWLASILLIWLWPLASDLLMTLIWLASIFLICLEHSQWLWSGQQLTNSSLVCFYVISHWVKFNLLTDD